MISQERLKEILSYCPETGLFTWINSPRNSVKGQSIAGSPNCQGYIHIKISRRLYKAHRLAWLYVYGEHPEKEIDHINNIKSDNRISNLRLASRSENQCNRQIQKNNKSGCRGVSWDSGRSKWRADIMFNGKKKYLGRFKDKESAESAYKDASLVIHGEFSKP